MIPQLQFNGVAVSDFQLGLLCGALGAVLAGWVVLVLALSLLKSQVRP